MPRGKRRFGGQKRHAGVDGDGFRALARGFQAVQDFNQIGDIDPAKSRRPVLSVPVRQAMGAENDRIEAAHIAYQLPMPLPYRAYRTLLKHGGPLTWWLAQAKNGLDDGAYPSMVSDVRAGRVTPARNCPACARGRSIAAARSNTDPMW